MAASDPVNTASVLPSAAGTPYAQPEAPAAAFGGNIGGALTQAGQQGFAEAQRIQGLQNETNANDISTDYYKKLGVLKGQFYSLQGQAAVAAAPKFQDDVIALRNDTLAQAGNPMMRQMLAQDVNKQNAYTLSGVGQFVGQETRKASIQSSASKVDVLADTAVQARNNPQQITDAVNNALGEVKKMGELQGWDADTLSAKSAQTVGSIYSKVIGTLANEDPTQAAAVFTQARDHMDASSVEKITQELRPKLLNATADKIAGMFTPAPAGTPQTLSVPEDMKPMIATTAAKYGVPENVAQALVQGESNFNPAAVNKVSGARGLTQVLDSTARSPGFGMAGVDPLTLNDPQANLDFGLQYFAQRAKAAGVTDLTDPAQIHKAFSAYYSGAPAATQRYADNQTALATGGKVQSLVPSYTAPDLDTMLTQAQKVVDQNGGDPELAQRVQSKVMQQYHLWSTETAGQRAALQKGLVDVNAALEDGRPVAIPEQQIRSLLPAEKADEVVEQLQTAQQLGQVVQSVRGAAAADIPGLREQIANGAGPLGGIGKKGNLAGGDGEGPTDLQGYAAKDKALKLFDAAVLRRQEAITADPAAYIQQSSPGVAAAFSAYQQDQSPQSWSTYATAAQAEQTRLGVPADKQALLPKPMVAALTQQIENVDPEKGSTTQTLNGMQKMYGDQWGNVLHQMVTQGGLKPTYAVLASMNAPDQVAAQADMQRTLNYVASNKEGLKGLEQYAGTAAKGDIDKNIDATMADFKATTAMQSAGVNLSNQVQDSVRQLALYYAGTGAAKTGQDALDMAKAGILDSKYDFQDSVRVPKGQLPVFNTVSSAVQSNLKAEDISTDYLPRQFLDKIDAASMLRVAQQGKWVPNAKDDGVILMGQLKGASIPMRGRDGSYIGFKFADMPGIAKGASDQPAATAAPDQPNTDPAG